jgi:hypothetical protein
MMVLIKHSTGHFGPSVSTLVNAPRQTGTPGRGGAVRFHDPIYGTFVTRPYRTPDDIHHVHQRWRMTR